MKIRVNGREQNLANSATTVAELLGHLGVPTQKTAIEVNGSIVDQESFDETRLNDGDTVEIVSFVGGG